MRQAACPWSPYLDIGGSSWGTGVDSSVLGHFWWLEDSTTLTIFWDTTPTAVRKEPTRDLDWGSPHDGGPGAYALMGNFQISLFSILGTHQENAPTRRANRRWQMAQVSVVAMDRPWAVLGVDGSSDAVMTRSGQGLIWWLPEIFLHNPAATISFFSGRYCYYCSLQTRKLRAFWINSEPTFKPWQFPSGV